MASQGDRQIVMNVGRRIEAARKEKGWTRRELARRVHDVDQLAVYRWEKRGHLPRPENFVALARALDKPVAWFYEDAPGPETPAAA